MMTETCPSPMWIAPIASEPSFPLLSNRCTQSLLHPCMIQNRSPFVSEEVWWMNHGVTLSFCFSARLDLESLTRRKRYATLGAAEKALLGKINYEERFHSEYGNYHSLDWRSRKMSKREKKGNWEAKYLLLCALSCSHVNCFAIPFKPQWTESSETVIRSKPFPLYIVSVMYFVIATQKQTNTSNTLGAMEV